MLLLPWEDEPVATGAHLRASQLRFNRDLYAQKEESANNGDDTIITDTIESKREF